MLDRQSNRGPGQKFGLRFLFHLNLLANSVAMMSTLTALCQWEDEMVRKRIGHPSSYAVAEKMKLWLRAFLTGRSVSVVMGSSRSDWSGVAFGLPQGSTLGLLLYILYTADLSMILSPLGVAAHQYADDTQAYVHGVASEAISLVEKMLLVSDVTGAWLSSNRLGLNPGKTQFIWVGGRVQLSKIDLSILLERFPGVLFSTTVRDLG